MATIKRQQRGSGLLAFVACLAVTIAPVRASAESSATSSSNPNSSLLDLNKAEQAADLPRAYLRRVQRSGPSMNEAQFADLISAAREQEYRRQLAHQLPELLVRASNDKSLGRALLNALIQQQQRLQPNDLDQEQQQLFSNSQSLNKRGLFADMNYGADLGSLNSNFISSQDQSSSSDLDDGPEMANSGANPQLITWQLAKRSMKPCNFNAISCAKNPFRRF